MVFPDQPRAVLAELQVGSTDWANITSDILTRDAITITRGQSSEGTQSSPATCTFTLKNTAGRYSPRNPMSPLFKQIGRNTPVRISIGRGAYGLVLVGGSTGRGEVTADTVATSITGDMDIRVDMELLSVGDLVPVASDWTTGTFDIASKYRDANASRSWTLRLIAGKLRFNWFTLGTVASVKQADSTVTMPGPAQGRRAVRVVLDVDNGAAQNTVTFYTAPTMAGPWTQLGAVVTQAGVTSVFDGDAVLRVGANIDASTYSQNSAPAATVYSAELRGGVGAGTVVANPNFAGQPLDPVPFAQAAFFDSFSNFWFFNGTADAARIWYGDLSVRFWGEISSLPPSWDVSEVDATAEITASGLLRRLGQGTDPAQTGLKDFILSDKTALAAYFPLDGESGTAYSLNLGGTYYLSTRFYPQTVTIYTIPPTRQSPVFTYGKDMGSILGSGMELNATGQSYMRGDVGTGDPNCALDFMWQGVAPGLGVLGAEIQDYNIDTWSVILNTSTSDYTAQVYYNAYSGGGIPVYFPATGVIAALGDVTRPHYCRLQLTSTGGNTNYALYIDGVLVDSGTRVGATLNGVSLTRAYYTRYSGQTVCNISHWTLWANANAALIPPAATVYQAATGYSGENAAQRLTRICSVGNIPFTLDGTAADTTIMGPQYSEAKLTQLRDAEATDLGILTEPRNGFGLLYRTMRSMMAQTPAVTLDHSAKQLAQPFEPTDDDTLTRNDMSVQRREGGSYRLTKESGTLSAANPPVGVGRYRDEATVNTLTDEQLPGIAAWLVANGTLDEARFPVITADLTLDGIKNTAGLDAACQAADIGDLLVLTQMAALSMYADVSLIILGYTETISDGAFKHVIKWNCAPGTLFRSAVYGSTPGSGPDRYDTGGSTLVSGVSTTATSLSVATVVGAALWTTDATAWPFDIQVAGEQMRVTNVTGATSPQTLTVTRSVNGVVKSQAAGAEIRLWKTPRYAL
jgi:hypothetical protein